MMKKPIKPQALHRVGVRTALNKVGQSPNGRKKGVYMANNHIVKKALLRRIRRLMSVCGPNPEIIELLGSIEDASGKNDYNSLFNAIDELCCSLFDSKNDDNEE